MCRGDGEKLILAVVGHPLTGKDTAADYISQKFGFFHVSSSEPVRRNISVRGLGEPTRDLMRQVANEMRCLRGEDILLRLALDEAEQATKIVISGLRALAEGQHLKRIGGKIIAINVPVELRYQRALSRQRAGDFASFAEFSRLEKQESGTSNANTQNVNALHVLADYSISNDGTLDDLQAKIDGLIPTIFPTISD